MKRNLWDLLCRKASLALRLKKALLLIRRLARQEKEINQKCQGNEHRAENCRHPRQNIRSLSHSKHIAESCTCPPEGTS